MPELDYRGLRYGTHSAVYAPHDDTWLLVDAVLSMPRLVGARVVEVGCGAGLGLIAAATRGATGLGIDRNAMALRLARENAVRNQVSPRLGFVRGDLVSSLALDKVDLLLFNPPYLPTDLHERLPGDLNLAFDGGPSGAETILRFAKALQVAREAGRDVPPVLLVTSTLNDRNQIRRALAAAGLEEVEGLGTRAFQFERLFVERYASA